MFKVGRYDPREDDRPAGRKGGSGPPTSSSRSSKPDRKRGRPSDFEGGRKANSARTVSSHHESTNNDASLPKTDASILQRASPAKGKAEETRVMASDSSSSVPSSSDESDGTGDENTQLSRTKQSTLRVIAPKQVQPNIKKKNLGLPDEALDDFDVDVELLDSNTEDVSGDAKSEIRDNSQLPKEIRTALHMSSLPIEEAAAVWDLAPFLIANLKRDGYESFFPIQSLVIPDVITSERHAHIRARDICVAAPTGSGKTLSFVLPVLNALSKRIVRRLRALVVLPSRDLASQVYEVFDRYTHGSDLRVGLAIGQSDFEAEQRALTVGPRDASTMDDLNTARLRYFLNHGSVDLALEAFPGLSDVEAPPKDGKIAVPDGGVSALDILIATPGRLVDHLDRTPGFTLQHLRFLVIDECDRLLNQSYHNWIGRVVASANAASVNAWHKLSSGGSDDDSNSITALRLAPDRNSFVIDPITWRRGGAAGDDSAFSNNYVGDSVEASVCCPAQLRKLLFSATLTKDPQKLASLGLVNPKFFDAHHLNSQQRGASSQRYSMPVALLEYTVECTAEQKPLVLLALLLDQLQQNEKLTSKKCIVAVFTSSLDSTHRLVRLLQLLWKSAGYGDPLSVAEFSSALNQNERTKLVKRCTDADGDVSVVVCSDGMSRGMDIPSVSAVINYDVPIFAKTYVHRCGRTARAGKQGMAISLLKGGQVRQFQRMRNLIDDPSRVKEMTIKKDLVRDAVTHYRACVKALREVIQAEEEGNLSTTNAIPGTFLHL